MIFDLLDQVYNVTPTQNICKKVFDSIETGGGTLSVGEITTAIEKSSNEVSTAIRRLVNAGFVVLDNKSGKKKFYKVHPQLHLKINALRDFLKPYES